MTTTGLLLISFGIAGALLTLGYRIGYAGGHYEGYLLGIEETEFRENLYSNSPSDH